MKKEDKVQITMLVINVRWSLLLGKRRVHIELVSIQEA